MRSREIYLLGLSGLRGLVRCAADPEQRNMKLLEACKDRRNSFGDQYSKAIHIGSRMAEKTLEDGVRVIDFMKLQQACMGEKLCVVNPEAAKAFSRIRMISYDRYRVGRLPR